MVPMNDLSTVEVSCYQYNEGMQLAVENLRNDEPQHNQEILTRLLHQPYRQHQDENDVKSQHHRKKLGLENSEVKAGDDDVCKRT